jgi:hypothetical protein
MNKRSILFLILLVGLVGTAGLRYACVAPPSRYAPLFVNNTFYLCCNMYYPSPRFHDANYQMRGTFIPLGTQVKVTAMTDAEVTFIDVASNRQFTWVKRYSRAPLASLLGVWFVNENPRDTVDQFDESVRTLIYTGKAVPGMTKQQVILALGFPPEHKTPDTSLDVWTYWKQNPYTVQFSNGIVTSVGP